MEISGKTLITLLQHSRKMAHVLKKGESARGRFGAVSALPQRRVPTLRSSVTLQLPSGGRGVGTGWPSYPEFQRDACKWPEGHFRGSYEVRGIPQSRSENREISQSLLRAPPPHPAWARVLPSEKGGRGFFPNYPSLRKCPCLKGN